MRIAGVVIVCFLFLVPGFLFANTPVQKVQMKLDGSTTEDIYYGNFPENPPPIDSTCLVFAGVDYGNNFDSPQAYPCSKQAA